MLFMLAVDCEVARWIAELVFSGSATDALIFDFYWSPDEEGVDVKVFYLLSLSSRGMLELVEEFIEMLVIISDRWTAGENSMLFS